MKRSLIILFFAAIIIILLIEDDNSQYEDYSFYPNQDIINIFNKGWKDKIFEVGNFNYENSFLSMSKTQNMPRYHSVLKGYDDGNYILETSDFGNEKINVITNSEFEFYSDSGKAWFFYDGRKSNEQYSFFAAIIDNKRIRKPFKINIYDGDDYVFGYIKCDYSHPFYNEEKIYYLPLTENSYGYSVDIDYKINGYKLDNVGFFVVFEETMNNNVVEIETSKSKFEYNIDLSESMNLEIKKHE